MDIRVFEPTDGEAVEDCLFLLGWGNRCRHETVRWLVDRLRSEYRVHAVELPTHITDLQREWVAPVSEYAADLDSFTLLSHSAGGLTGAHLDCDGISQRVYLSPWWGSNPVLPGAVFSVVRRLPISRPVLPTGELEGAYLGALATDQQVAEAPENVSPAFLDTIAEAQSTLPPARAGAVAFGTLSDRIVDPRRLGRLPADNIRLYDGGHELFSSPARERLTPTVLDALARGPAAL